MPGSGKNDLSRQERRRAPSPPEPRRVNVNAAGIDIGAGHHYVAVPEGGDPEGRAVRQFGCFTDDLCALADWLSQCGIETVAMESTGVYWIPLYELLAERGFDVKLVDPRRLKNVPGRKTEPKRASAHQRGNIPNASPRPATISTSLPTSIASGTIAAGAPRISFAGIVWSMIPRPLPIAVISALVDYRAPFTSPTPSV
jgi:Transposase